MLTNKEMNQAEELSQCLDHMNDGVYPSTQDDEIKELVELASFVKQSYNNEELPKTMIHDMVENLSVELRAKKQKRRVHWLYGSLVGTAAAVLIFASVQFLFPQSPDKNIAQQLDNNIETQNFVATIDQARDPIISQSTNTMVDQQVQSVGSGETSVVLPAEKKATDEVAKVLVEIIQGVESPEADSKPTQVAMLKQEMSNDIMMKKSTFMATRELKSLEEDKKSQFAGGVEMMVLPNQTAQSVTVENHGGVIRQVYNQGTHDEIIITQRVIDESRETTRDGVQRGRMQAVAGSVAIQPMNEVVKEVSNSVTVKMDKYDITIEGNKTEEELEKVVQSLIKKDIEQ